METLSADGAYQVSVTKVTFPLPLRANVVIIQAAHVVFKQLHACFVLVLQKSVISWSSSLHIDVRGSLHISVRHSWTPLAQNNHPLCLQSQLVFGLDFV